MHQHNLEDWVHEHSFSTGNRSGERRTRLAAWITLVAMAVEITAGWWFNSMALLADGWHMSSHALALGLSAFAYSAARRYATDPRFAFGTWKIEILGGFASAVLLLAVAALMVEGSIERLLAPQDIHYREAIVVAVLGLAVNVLCAVILSGGHEHSHLQHAHQGHSHGPGHKHDHDDDHRQDLNLKSAYVHVITDALTSVLAIVALTGGLLYGWAWLDPAMGIVGAALVTIWAINLIRATSAILLDREMDHPVVDEIRAAVETGPDHGNTRVTDLHVWRVGTHVYACAMSLMTHDRDLTPEQVRAQLAEHEEVVHSTIEIHQCHEAVN